MSSTNVRQKRNDRHRQRIRELCAREPRIRSEYEQRILELCAREPHIRPEYEQRIRELEGSAPDSYTNVQTKSSARLRHMIRELEARESRIRSEYEQMIRELEARESPTPEIRICSSEALGTIKGALDRLPLGDTRAIRADLKIMLTSTTQIGADDLRHPTWNYKLFNGKNDMELAVYIRDDLRYNTPRRLRQLQEMFGKLQQGAEAECFIRERLDHPNSDDSSDSSVDEWSYICGTMVWK